MGARIPPGCYREGTWNPNSAEGSPVYICSTTRSRQAASSFKSLGCGDWDGQRGGTAIVAEELLGEWKKKINSGEKWEAGVFHSSGL